MSKTLTEIAQQLNTPKVIKKRVPQNSQTKEIEEVHPVPKVQLIYAFNGTGKTRLSREMKKLFTADVDAEENASPSVRKFLYYSAFTEDLFYWDNDLALDAEPKLKIQPNSFTDWILKEQGQDQNIVTHFQRYVNDKLTPSFNDEYEDIDKDGSKIIVPAFSEVTFSYERGDDTETGKIKISKGEESNFIWSVFHALLDQVITILNVAEPTERETDQFDQLECVFIDDPVSSLDENHLIELAVNLADLIKNSQSGLKFIITTHSSLFYNVLHNEFNKKTCYMLERSDDGTYSLEEKQGNSNKSFSYHLHLKKLLETAIADNKIERYHFTLLRNLYEKTASFLGYPKWSELLPGDKTTYFNRIIQFTSHSTLSNEAVAEPSPEEKQIVKFLLAHLQSNYAYWQQEGHNG